MTNQKPKFVVGLGIDALGYIVLPEFFEKHLNVKHTEHLTEMLIDKEAGTILMDEINTLIKEK